MDIRTRLVFALVAVALGSMLLLGGIMYADASRLLETSTRERIEGLAESRKDALISVLEGWRDRVQLVASRTQLRQSLSRHNESGSPEASARIERILEDAVASVRTIESLSVYDLAGRLVASWPPGLALDSAFTRVPSDLSDRARLLGVSVGADGHARTAFGADLTVDGERQGAVVAVLNTRDLAALTGDYAGLGETGEVLIVARDDTGSPVLLHPVRHGSAGGTRPRLANNPDHPATRALRGEEAFLAEGGTDYRGEPVWASTRYLPEVEWGLVVKFDAAEKVTVVTDFRNRVIDVGLSLAAFAILIGTVLGLRFARPIHDLADAASRIRDGELEARSTVTSEDEVGLLAKTFNEMADQLEERMALLKEFHRFFEVSLDMLCIAGTDGYFKRTNPAFERTLGWSGEELMSKPFIDFVHPDDVEATRQEVEKLAAGKPTISFVNRYRSADGDYKHLRWTTYPDPETGRLYAIARLISDDKPHLISDDKPHS